MGTVEKICESLLKSSEERSQHIRGKFEEYSIWLGNEIELMKKLIRKNPRENHAPQNKPEVIEEKEDDSRRQKRKSPEVAIGGSRSSPDQKRASGDFDKIFSIHGTDINKFKKEQLLAELEKRGDTSLDMKSRKQTMIDALKDLLLQEENQQVASKLCGNTENDVFEGCQDVFPDHAENEVFEGHQDVIQLEIKDKSPVTSLAPQRKGSLMADIRANLSNPSKIEEESEESRRARLENEFAARQRRHRDSQARKSQMTCENSNPVQQDNDLIERSSMDLSISSPLKQSNDTSNEMVESPSQTDKEAWSTQIPEDGEIQEAFLNDYMESHMKNCDPNKIEATSDEDDVEGVKATDDQEISDVSSAQEVFKVLDVDSQLDNEFSEDAIVMQTSTVNETSSSKLCSGLTKSSESGVPTNLIAPSNLMVASNVLSGQISFLDKPVSKPKVAALEKAKQLRAAEELKASQKKRELEAKIASQAVNKNIVPSGNSKIQGSSKLASTAIRVPVNRTGNAVNDIKKAPSVQNPMPSGMGKSTIVSSSASSSAISSAQIASAATSSTSVKMTESILKSKSALNQSNSTGITEIHSQTSQQSLPDTLPFSSSSSVQSSMPQCMDLQSSSYVKKASVFSQSAVETKQVLNEIKIPDSNNEENEPEEDQYEMRDADDDSDSGSGTDSGSDGEYEQRQKERNKNIPEWAREPQLSKALERQYGLNGTIPVDPDLIFSEVQTCCLEEIFGKSGNNHRMYNRRTSSAKWDVDQLTSVEKTTYRVQMGFGKPTI